jgi:hypothetical protein
MRYKKVVILTVVSLVLLMLCYQMLCYQMVTVKANPTYTPADYLTAINAAASRLVALQSAPPENSTGDYGWDWIVTSETQHSTAESANNVYGVTALDLVDAYQKTGNSTYLKAAENTANYMMTQNATNWGEDMQIGLTNHFGYSSDYELLMELAAASGNSTFSTFAKAAWAWQKANGLDPYVGDPTYGMMIYADGNQSLLWDYEYYTGEPGVAAWQTADWGLVALLMGDTVWSAHMADVIHGNMTALTTETITGNSGNNYPVDGMGEALKFFATSPYASATYAADITAMVARLTAIQNHDGSWSQGDPPAEDAQSTAYAVMGLDAAHAWTAALNGANWLISQQVQTGLYAGGWLEPDSNEYSEVDSECMSALIASIAQLTVISAHGSPNPAVGTSTYFVGTTVTASVNSPVAGPENIEYVCTGWTGTGDVPASGTGTTVTFTLTKDPTLTWNWKMEYLFVPMIWASSVYLEGPCQTGNTFTVQVYLWNQQSWTGDAIMGFDFNLWWYASTNDFTCANHVISNTPPQPFITLESAVFTSPWANYFVVYNGTATGTPPASVSNGWAGYELAITGEPPSAALTNVNITLATLTFQINGEPCFPDVWQTPLTFNAIAAPTNVKLSTPDGSPITIFEADDGLFNLEPGTPDANLAFPATLPTDAATGYPYILEYKVGDYYTFEVWMTNMTHAYGFDFDLCYNPDLLSLDQPNGITISPVFPQPYSVLEEFTNNINYATGQAEVYVKLQRPTSKPLVCGNAINVANVTFISVCLNPKTGDPVQEDMLSAPSNLNSTVQLCEASQYSLCCGYPVYYQLQTSGVYVSYDQGVTWLQFYPPTSELTPPETIGPALYNNVIEYYFRPIEVKGENTAYENGYVTVDLNLDGKVDILDLSALAAVYGVDLSTVTPPAGVTPAGWINWGQLAHPSSVVDIFDFVLVAKAMGMTWTPSLVPWP